MDALGIGRATLGGYDWGGRAACIVAALHPARVQGLLSITGYNIQNIARCEEPAGAAEDYSYWYQWYFNTERGRNGLDAQPARHLPAAVAAVVAELGVRRRHLRPHRRQLRQP